MSLSNNRPYRTRSRDKRTYEPRPQPYLSGLELFHIEELIRTTDKTALPVLANLYHGTWPVTREDIERARRLLFEANLRAWQALKALRGDA